MVDTASMNPFSNFNVGSLGTYGEIGLVIVLALFILGLIGFIIYFLTVRKQYWIRIEVSRNVGNTPTRVALYSAKEVPFGMAGDKLWKVAPAGLLKLKTIKWLPVGKYQSAANTFKYWIRSDGEWINYKDKDIDEASKEMNVTFVQEDMRLQRLATDRLLEQRLMQKSFWDKWKDTIMTILFFLVIAVSIVIVFYQFSKVVDKMGPMMEQLSKALTAYSKICTINGTAPIPGGTGLVPA